MTCWALVAIKESGRCKQRLAGVLSPAQRDLLARRMLEDVIDALAGTGPVDRIAVVSPQPYALNREVIWLSDPGIGLNHAVSLSMREMESRGATELLVVHPDVPLVRAAEIEQLIEAGRLNGLALAPDRLGQGTNGLFLRLPSDFDFQFGPGSLVRHRAQAVRLGFSPGLAVLPGLAFDVDRPEDLGPLLAGTGARRYGFLRHSSRGVPCFEAHYHG